MAGKTKKTYKRRRTYKKKAKYVPKAVKTYVKRAFDKRVETKHTYYNQYYGLTTMSANTAVTYAPLNYVPQGSTQGDRIGDKIHLKGLKMRLHLSQNYGSGIAGSPEFPGMQPCVVRVVAFWYEAGSVPTNDVVFESANTGSDTNDIITLPIRKENVTPIFNRIVKLPPPPFYPQNSSGPVVERYLNIYKRMNRNIQYKEDASTPKLKQIWIWVITPDGQTTGIGGIKAGAEFRVYYKDA